MSHIIVACIALVVGYLLGRIIKDEQLWRLCEDQQARGDYWFDKYKKAIKQKTD